MSHANEHTEQTSRRFVFHVFRYTAGQAEPPRFDTYELDAVPGMTVLTALFEIQQRQDTSLAFRFSCVYVALGITQQRENNRKDKQIFMHRISQHLYGKIRNARKKRV